MSHWHKWGCDIKLLWIRPWQNHCFETDPGHSQRSAAKWDCTKLPTTFLTLISVWVSTLTAEPYNPFASGCFGGFCTCWGCKVRLFFLGSITENHCWGLDVKECRYLKEPNLPSKGNNALPLLFAVLHSLQSSCKCVIWMSVQWAHYLHGKHLCFQVKYFQEAVLLLALYSSSLSSMKKTNHEKSLCFKWWHWNNFVLVSLKGERHSTLLSFQSAVFSLAL